MTVNLLPRCVGPPTQCWQGSGSSLCSPTQTRWLHHQLWCPIGTDRCHLPAPHSFPLTAAFRRTVTLDIPHIMAIHSHHTISRVGLTDWQTDRLTDRQVDRRTDRQRQTDRQRDRRTDTASPLCRLGSPEWRRPHGRRARAEGRPAPWPQPAQAPPAGAWTCGGRAACGGRPRCPPWAPCGRSADLKVHPSSVIKFE